MDAGRIARLRDVLAGGHLALEPDRRLAASILQRWSWAAGLVKDANDFHRRSAAWAVRGGTPDFPVRPAAGVIFAASGYPLPPYGFHEAAARARPDALFTYADTEPAVAAYSKVLLACPPPLSARPSTFLASARDPAALLGAPEARAVLGRGPVMVQLQLCVHWWPAQFCAWAVGEYARLLPAGSTLALSLGVPGGADGLGEFMRELGRGGGTVYAHTEADVAGWVAAAGLALTPAGVADVRSRDLGWAAAEFRRQRTIARMVGAVAVVP
jgi:hypothetical protein